jgi:hypothetical protein
MTAPQQLITARWKRSSLPRSAVILTALCWLLLVSPFPPSLHGAGVIILLALVGLDITLGISTEWLAVRPTSSLDERQAAIRDRAYRVAFRLIAVGVLVLVICALVDGARRMEPSGLDVLDGVSARRLLAILELLVITPTAVTAWLAGPASETGPETRGGRQLYPMLLVPLVAVAWFAATQVLAPGLTTASGMSGGFELSGATCAHYAAERSVAAGFAGAVRLRAEVCWDGQHAFAFGDPSLHTPPGVVPSPVPADELAAPLTMPSLPDLTSCMTRDADTDFVVVSEGCTEQIDADGTMRLT